MTQPTKTLWTRLVIHTVSSEGVLLDLIAAESLGCAVKRHRLYLTHDGLLELLAMVERHRAPEKQPDPQEDPEQQRLPW